MGKIKNTLFKMGIYSIIYHPISTAFSVGSKEPSYLERLVDPKNIIFTVLVATGFYIGTYIARNYGIHKK